MFKKVFLRFFALFFAIAQLANAQSKKDINRPVQVMQEFRAAWIASVANINWPSKPGLSTEEQKREAIVLLDLLKSLNFNAAVLQIRPQADALYKSDIEPWSYFLTGEQGKAPEPYYDPLTFWTEEAHDRGLELHVWLNPYRAHHLTGKEISEKSVVTKHSDLVVKLKDGQYWMDPSLKGVQDLSAAVVRDIVKRYDIDGVHFDDYFYPYESYNGGADFPDDASWASYQQSGGKLSRADWRRESVNKFIERVYKEIKKEKKYVKFGLSPFGIWRPGYPESIEGFDQYDKLYADAKLWLNKGWIDYFTPQLYWKVNDIAHSFPVLLNWWQSENTKNRHLWPGMNIGLGGDEKNVDEVINQIMITRGITPQSKGSVHWSIAGIVRHQLLRDGLLAGPYKKGAIVPASPWLDKKAPKSPKISVSDKENDLLLSWTAEKPEDVFKWVVYYKYANKWSYHVLTKKEQSLALLKNQLKPDGQPGSRLQAYAVTAVDRTGNESKFLAVDLTN